MLDAQRHNCLIRDPGVWHADRVDGTDDPEVDAAYLRLIPTVEAGSSKRQVVARSDDLAGELVCDVDEDGRIIGIEVLDATPVLRPETIAQLKRLGAA